MISHWDIHNAYPAQLAKLHLPVGNCRELADAAACRALDGCEPGLYTLSVRVPDDSFLPPLPWAHSGQMNFPTGDITGSWCLPEFVAAFERGVTVLKVHSALVWEATAPIFGPLVERWYEIRRAAGKKTPLGQWISRLAKALTGKLAERPERCRVLMHPESVKVCLRVGRCKNGCTGRCGAYEQIDLYGKIWGVPYQRLGGSSYPQWSAYLRAATRVQWLAQAERQGKEYRTRQHRLDLDPGPRRRARSRGRGPAASGGSRRCGPSSTCVVTRSTRAGGCPIGSGSRSIARVITCPTPSW